ncbi:MAG TPA: hypothetical protein VK436_05990 [Methanocella sp.]|nr:hypothetical protein [Methanocella sp.]
MLRLEINLMNKEFEGAEFEQDRISNDLLELYYKGNEQPYLDWLKNRPPLPAPLPIYFLLADDEEVILQLGDDLIDGTTKKPLYLPKTPAVYDPRRPSSGFRLNTIIQGMFGLAMVLFCDHEPYWRSGFENSWPNVIKDENTFFNSYPLFVPDCSFGCCGGDDLGISIDGDKVRIIRAGRPDLDGAEKDYLFTLDEYLDVVIRCLEELYHMGGECGSSDAFWFMVFLLKKASLEGRNEIRKPLLKKFMRFVKDNNVYLDGW